MKKQEKEETFLKSRPQYDDFKHLLADQYLTEASDEGKIKKLKKAFGLAVKYHNDETAKKLLELIEKSYKDSQEEFRDYLMEIYWQLPDMKPDRQACRDIMRPTMLQTKFWILEKVIRDWGVDFTTRKITEASIRVFQFLIAAYEPLREDWHYLAKNADFRMKSKGRRVSQKEKDQILELIRKHDTRFKPEELEEWMKQPWIPHEFERILAIARTREGGPKLWQKDIRNAELLKPFSPDERTAAAIDLHKRHCQVIVSLDQSVKELLKRMHSEGLAKGEEIGGSEYVLGEEKVSYNNLFEIIIFIKMRPEYSEGLMRDNFGRAKRHINQWLGENRSRKVILKMSGGETDINLSDEFFGERHYLTN